MARSRWRLHILLLLLCVAFLTVVKATFVEKPLSIPASQYWCVDNRILPTYVNHCLGMEMMGHGPHFGSGLVVTNSNRFASSQHRISHRLGSFCLKHALEPAAQQTKIVESRMGACI